jgi:hypothetical protein
MLKRFFLLLLFCAPLTAGPFTGFFDSIDRDDLEKVMEYLEKMRPKVDPLPYFRTTMRGMSAAMGWHFRQEISRDVARERAVAQIQQAPNLTPAEREELIDIIEYLSEEPETLLDKGKNLFKKKKKKEKIPFRMEGVEIYCGALLSQVTWVPASNFGQRMIADGVRRAQL